MKEPLFKEEENQNKTKYVGVAALYINVSHHAQ